MEGTFIEIEAYGDYDMPYTECVMYTPEKRNVKSIVSNFCALNGLEGTCVPDNMVSDTNEEFIKFLKKEGFRPIQTEKVCFGD